MLSLANAQSFKLNSIDAPLDLTGRWLFQAGDDLAWAEPSFDDTDWQTLQVPKPWGRQGISSDWGWYRLSIKLSKNVLAQIKNTDHGSLLALTLGDIMGAYELYAGGQLIAALGQLEPSPKLHYGEHKTFVIPLSAIDSSGKIVIALRVWRGEATFRQWLAGTYGGPFLLGSLSALERKQLNSKILPLILTVIYLLVALYHLHLFLRVRVLKPYLWYSLMTLNIAAYTFSSSQWKFDLNLSFMTIKKLEHGVLYILPALLLEYSWKVLKVRTNLWLRLYQSVFIVLALLVVGVPNLSIHKATIDFWSVWSILAILTSMGLVLWRTTQKDNEAKVICIGAFIFMLSAMNDLALDQGLIESSRLMPLGFAALVLSMALALANQFTRIFNKMECLVVHRTQALKQVNEQRKQLVADIVHDVTTPLSVVTGYVQAFHEGDLVATPERYQTLREELQQISSLVEDLRFLSLADTGELKLEPQHVSVEQLLRGVTNAFLWRAKELGINLASDIEASLPTLVIDEDHMRRVLANLVSNSLRHTATGGEIQLSAKRDKDSVVLEVNDSGEGVAEEKIAHLFERFYRLDESRSSSSGGSGLGLAIAKSIVDLHGGNISARNREGKGLTVSIRLAISQV